MSPNDHNQHQTQQTTYFIVELIYYWFNSLFPNLLYHNSVRLTLATITHFQLMLYVHFFFAGTNRRWGYLQTTLMSAYHKHVTGKKFFSFLLIRILCVLVNF